MYWSFDRVGIVSLYTGCGTTVSLESKRVGVGVTIPLKVRAQSLCTLTVMYFFSYLLIPFHTIYIGSQICLLGHRNSSIFLLYIRIKDDITCSNYTTVLKQGYERLTYWKTS